MAETSRISVPKTVGVGMAAAEQAEAGKTGYAMMFNEYGLSWAKKVANEIGSC